MIRYRSIISRGARISTSCNQILYKKLLVPDCEQEHCHEQQYRAHRNWRHRTWLLIHNIESALYVLRNWSVLLEILLDHVIDESVSRSVAQNIAVKYSSHLFLDFSLPSAGQKTRQNNSVHLNTSMNNSLFVSIIVTLSSSASA